VTHTLPKLAYDYNALEPHIDARTMEIHHTKHHQGYVNKLNAALEHHPDLEGRNVHDLLTGIHELPEAVRPAVRNHGGGHANHSLFWQVMSPKGGGQPDGDLRDAIESDFGDFGTFGTTLTDAALSRFGSGWAWLVVADGRLAVESTANQDSPLLQGHIPILGIDVWEHAYYLSYQNRRADYVTAWWNVIDWDEVSQRYEQARGAVLSSATTEQRQGEV
jgi:Fe-Mn family superoxide dismutase